MDKEFESWWTINKFKLMENDENGVREIALAAFLAGKDTGKITLQKVNCKECDSGILPNGYCMMGHFCL